MKVLILIPAYNEAESIGDVIASLRQRAPNFDRLVVSDGSKDRTAEIAAEMGERVLKLPCNLGYGRAIQTGIRYALARGYDVLVFCDGDGQHRPEDVPHLVDALLSGEADVVIGSRFSEARPYSGPLGRRLGQFLFSHLTRLLIGRRIFDTTSGFKAIRAGVARELVGATFHDFHTETLVRLSLRGFTIIEVPVLMNERLAGKSMHALLSAVEYPLKTLVMTLVAAVDVLLERRAVK